MSVTDMKIFLLGLCSVVLLSACAGVRVCRTEVATGAVYPKAIYIRPFSVDYARYYDRGNPNGSVRKSLAPTAFANALQEELSKLAPAMVLADNETAPVGWLVEGRIEELDAMSTSALKIHVRITDVGGGEIADIASKDGVSEYSVIRTAAGEVVYEFDLKGQLCSPVSFGSVSAPGLGDAVPFGFRNAAERIYLALSPDPFRYGIRSSPLARN
jgi:hypothetical protein